MENQRLWVIGILLMIGLGGGMREARACPACPAGGMDLSFLPWTASMVHDHLLPATEVSFSWPVEGEPVLNSPFGPRQLGSQSARYDWHRGIDFTLPMGTPLYAPADAEVVHAGTHPNYRDTILQLRHTSQEPYVYTLYLHLQEPLVGAGDFVQRGDLIALSGQGAATYPHLHWEVRRGCLMQVCCENPYGYLGIENNPPPAPRTAAAGFTNRNGRMILVGFEFPKTEIDFGGLDLSWGDLELGFNLDELNALAPRQEPGVLDNPLYFAEVHSMPFVILPKRYNTTFSHAAYEVLFWNLESTVSQGTATLYDAGGLSTSADVFFHPAPLVIQPERDIQWLEPNSEFTIDFRVTNPSAVPRQVQYSALSVQSIPLTVSNTGGAIAPHATITVTVSGRLVNAPTSIGDAILLRGSIAGGTDIDALGAAFLSTSETRPGPNGLVAF